MQVENITDREIAGRPKVQGGQPYLNNETNQVLQTAMETAREWGDDFVSIEPIMMALLTVNSTVSRILKDAGCNMIQGYYFDKPLPKDEFEKRLKKPQY